jgi:hypothetical protein
VRALTIGLLSVVLGASTVLAVVPLVPADRASAGLLECNGSAALCDRSLGEVAFATSHNSMSSTEAGFQGPNQGATVADQLRDGIRGFQIDAYRGAPRGGRIWTDLEEVVDTKASELPRPLLALARQIHRRLGAPGDDVEREVYLCHTLCEIGATPMREFADDVKTFLDENPSSVLPIVIEDYVPPEELMEVFTDAGLASELLEVQPGAPLPTLGEMIRSGKRLFVTLEFGDGGPALSNAFAGLVEETPFNFPRGRDLRRPQSCEPHRGVDGSPVFQFNHWVTPARRRGISEINKQMLRERIAACTEARGRVPTLVAVDFAETGDVLDVVDELNDVEQPSQ